MKNDVFRNESSPKIHFPATFFSAGSGRGLLPPSPTSPKKVIKEKEGNEIQESRELTKERSKGNILSRAVKGDLRTAAPGGVDGPNGARAERALGDTSPRYDVERAPGIVEHIKWRVTPRGDSLETEN